MQARWAPLPPSFAMARLLSDCIYRYVQGGLTRGILIAFKSRGIIENCLLLRTESSTFRPSSSSALALGAHIGEEIRIPIPATSFAGVQDSCSKIGLMGEIYPGMEKAYRNTC